MHLFSVRMPALDYSRTPPQRSAGGGFDQAFPRPQVRIASRQLPTCVSTFHGCWIIRP